MSDLKLMCCDSRTLSSLQLSVCFAGSALSGPEVQPLFENESTNEVRVKLDAPPLMF